MKPKSIKSLLALALLAPGVLFAQTTAKTTPVGYVNLALGGASSVLANTDSYVSLPLNNTNVFSGAVASVSGSSITLAGSPALGTLSDAANPHMCVIASGAREGLTALITANTAGQVTISVPTGDNLIGVTAGDKIIINEAWTVKEIFGNTVVPAATQLLAFSGLTGGVNLAPDLIFEWDGTNWIDTGSFDIADNVVLFPSECLIIRNSSGTAIPAITMAGTVPTYKHRSVLDQVSATQDIGFAHTAAVGEVIGTSGLSSVCASGDQLLVFDNSLAGQNKSATQIIEFDGAAWIDTNSFDDVTGTFTINSGVGYVLRRTGSTAVLSDTPNYIPSL